MTHESSVIQVLYAGSLQVLMDELLPLFTRETGYGCTGQAGGSLEWARQLRQGSTHADILLSADASVNEKELMRPQEERAEWYLIYAMNELVLAYSSASPIAKEMQSIAADTLGWLQLLQGGYRLARPDPDADPKGYRTLFALYLAEKHYHRANLAHTVAGSPRNPKQLVSASELTPMLQRGMIDLAFMYRNQVEGSDIPFVRLPDVVNLGSSDYANEYAEASYRCTDGIIYQGTPIAYSATPLIGACNPLAQSAFLIFLTSPDALTVIQRHGFKAERLFIRPAHKAG